MMICWDLKGWLLCLAASQFGLLRVEVFKGVFGVFKSFYKGVLDVLPSSMLLILLQFLLLFGVLTV
jgi:hypothetical protein